MDRSQAVQHVAKDAVKTYRLCSTADLPNIAEDTLPGQQRGRLSLPSYNCSSEPGGQEEECVHSNEEFTSWWLLMKSWRDVVKS